MNAKNRLRVAQKKLEQVQENRFKTRAYAPPTVAHGTSAAPRNNSVPVFAGKIDPDDYLDIE